MDPNTKERIEKDIGENRVILFMKGTPAFPQCGFSNQAVQLLRFYGADFASVNVLEDMSVREGIKEFSDWPTIPQLYVGGQFIGGSDIMMEMHQSGELKSLLEPEEAADRQDASA